MELNKKDLLSNDFKEYKDNHFQKRVWEGSNTKYFINVEYYEFDASGITYKSFECKVQFMHAVYNKKDICYNYDFNCSEFTIKEIEGIVEKLFIDANKPYYNKE